MKTISSCNCSCHQTYNDNDSQTEKFKTTVDLLQKKVDKLQNDNFELRKINKSLNSQLNLLINDNDIVKNVKIDIQDYSDYTQFHNEDTLKEFFYLLVLCEKMKYLNMDHIWMIDSALLYKEVMNMDLAFYEWGAYLSRRLENENGLYLSKNKSSIGRAWKDYGIIAKLKNLWYESSLTFFNKIRSIKTQSNSPIQTSTNTFTNLSGKNSNSNSTNFTNKTNTSNSNKSTNSFNLSTSTTDIKRKYLELIKQKQRIKQKSTQLSNEQEIEQLLIESDQDQSYNSFLN